MASLSNPIVRSLRMNSDSLQPKSFEALRISFFVSGETKRETLTMFLFLIVPV